MYIADRTECGSAAACTDKFDSRNFAHSVSDSMRAGFEHRSGGRRQIAAHHSIHRRIRLAILSAGRDLKARGTMNTKDVWESVEQYLDNVLVMQDSALKDGLAAAETAKLPAIQVSSGQGKFLQLLARILGARNILEIGTLGGYSTIWMARALPEGGKIITLEADPKHADVARKNFARAGVETKVELRLGKALDTLPQIASEGRGPFDMFFIDANKSNMPEYFEWSLKLARTGSVIIADNVVR